MNHKKTKTCWNCRHKPRSWPSSTGTFDSTQSRDCMLHVWFCIPCLSRPRRPH